MGFEIDRLSWDDVRLVGAVAEAASLPGAADRLGVAHSTVFRRLRQIEGEVGCPLFERSGARLSATVAGEEIAAVARMMGAAMDGAALRLAGREPSPAGEVRVTTNDSLLVGFLTPLFAGFRRHCPDVRLDVVLGNPALNLSKRDADVAIRATDRPPDTLVGRKGARIAWALYEADDGASQNWVSLGDAMGAMKVVRHVTETVPPERIAFRVNTVLGLAEAVEIGIGRGYLPCFIGDTRPTLRRLGEPDPRFATDLWLLTHADLRHVPRVRALMDYLFDAVAERRGLLEGRGA
ncbi:LysR family transcriptional regulator [Aureimonas sp. ME7]|uniref:LysR family transcriptional regulator n=1 Tax=Aureimonas sp. ME7 TaxID=2744252 RepID=UPI0015F55F20|nr:LysR family transcriptional regulator [Aureimonas sp. ME7]